MIAFKTSINPIKQIFTEIVSRITECLADNPVLGIIQKIPSPARLTLLSRKVFPFQTAMRLKNKLEWQSKQKYKFYPCLRGRDCEAAKNENLESNNFYVFLKVFVVTFTFITSQGQKKSCKRVFRRKFPTCNPSPQITKRPCTWKSVGVLFNNFSVVGAGDRFCDIVCAFMGWIF